MPAPVKAKPTPRKPAAPATPVPETKAAPKNTPVAKAGGGPTGGTGTDVANVQTEGVVFPFPGYLNNIVRQIAVRFKPRNPGRASRRSVLHRQARRQHRRVSFSLEVELIRVRSRGAGRCRSSRVREGIRCSARRLRERLSARYLQLRSIAHSLMTRLPFAALYVCRNDDSLRSRARIAQDTLQKGRATRPAIRSGYEARSARPARRWREWRLRSRHSPARLRQWRSHQRHRRR